MMSLALGDDDRRRPSPRLSASAARPGRLNLGCTELTVVAGSAGDGCVRGKRDSLRALGRRGPGRHGARAASLPCSAAAAVTMSRMAVMSLVVMR